MTPKEPMTPDEIAAKTGLTPEQVRRKVELRPLVQNHDAWIDPNLQAVKKDDKRDAFLADLKVICERHGYIVVEDNGGDPWLMEADNEDVEEFIKALKVNR
jgi:nicotinamide riboside kinase